MIGKPEWFKRRKYGGWGIAPNTWQGIVYIILILAPFVIFQALPFWNNEIRIYATIGWLAFLFLDVSHIMVSLKRDERESKIESLSERNAAWVMVLIIILGVLYQIINSALQSKIEVDWFLVIALFAGMIAKSLSNYIYERRTL